MLLFSYQYATKSPIRVNRTFYFKNKPKIIAGFSVGGPKESHGSIGNYIDYKLSDASDFGAMYGRMLQTVRNKYFGENSK